MFFSLFQRYLPVFFCLLNLVFAVREKQIKLEDIEKDNLATERRVQQNPSPSKEQLQLPQQYISPPQQVLRIQPHYQSEYLPQALPQLQQQFQQFAQFPQFSQFQLQQLPQLPQFQQPPQFQQQQQFQQPPQQKQPVAPKRPLTPPRFQFGFKPMKTQPQPVQKPQTTQTQQYNIAPQQYSLPQEFFNFQSAQQQQPQHQLQQTLPPSRAQQYVQSQPQYQQYELPYVTDNQLSAQDSNSFQQYYNPQLFYLQQYPSASTSIQTVVDPKGGLQYVMYLPSQYLQGAKAEQTQTVETLLQPQSQQQVYTSQDLSSVQGLLGGDQQYQFVDVPQAQPQIQSQAQVAPETPKFAEVQYVPQQQQQLQPEILQKAPRFEFVQPKYEPKSLLDSYVPSLLQIQYLKQQQQQAQANAIQQSLKPPQPAVGKGDFNKNYVPQSAASAQNFNYQFNQFSSRPTRLQRTKQ